MFFSGVFGVLHYRREIQTAKWPSVKGVVLHAQRGNVIFAVSQRVCRWMSPTNTR